MANYFNKSEIFAWMPLTGFDKEAPDKGVDKLMNRVGYDLHGVCLFVFHPDIVHHHDGMENVRVLPPDNCSYYANPYNEERRRQQWTNHELKDLAKRLCQRGTECYISIMGISLDSYFHDEWIYDHPELLNVTGGKPYGLNVLKRFKDGTCYEDYFADKICEVMEDYGFTGLHVSDNFCPPAFCLYEGDFSYDMLDQFVTCTGIVLPDELMVCTDNDSDIVSKRREWIWSKCRAEWIEFHAYRWERFFKKICDRLHAIGKKVFVLGMYCTDPFVTLYTMGIDLRRIVDAGVDYLMPNQAANGSLIARNRPWRYYEWANMISLSDAFAPNAKKLNMLTVKDTAEQWDVLHHAPTLLERDISFLTSYNRYTSDGIDRCVDGFNICLADGIYDEEWKWLSKRFDVAFGELPQKMLTPTLVWSDVAFDNTLREYIRTRRWTLHKFIYEINKLGAHCAGIVRTEDITERCGDLFVPNFDLLSDTEQEKILNYKGGAVIATAAIDKFDRSRYNCDLYFEDVDTPYPVCAFVLNKTIEDKDTILSLLSRKDLRSEAIEDVNEVEEVTNTLNQFMPYQKLSVGFLEAVAELLKLSYKHIIESTHPVIPMVMEDGRIRLYAMNDDLIRYAGAHITVNSDIEKVVNVSCFPLLPVKFSDDKVFNYKAKDVPDGNRTFQLLIPQGGVSVVDIYIE